MIIHFDYSNSPKETFHYQELKLAVFPLNIPSIMLVKLKKTQSYRNPLRPDRVWPDGLQ